jgi:hypothetical protein
MVVCICPLINNKMIKIGTQKYFLFPLSCGLTYFRALLQRTWQEEPSLFFHV